jgi:hypothetical protein
VPVTDSLAVRCPPVDGFVELDGDALDQPHNRHVLVIEDFAHGALRVGRDLLAVTGDLREAV